MTRRGTLLWTTAAIALLGLLLVVQPWQRLRGPRLDVVAAHVRGAPVPGERIFADVLIHNAGGRSATKIAMTVHSSGKPGDRSARIKGIWLRYEGVLNPSESVWAMAVAKNDWGASDDPAAISIFGRLTYEDLAGGKIDQPICLVLSPPIASKHMDPGPLLVQCGQVAPKPLLPMQIGSAP